MDKFLNALNELRVRLNNSGVERAVGVGKAMGKKCDYYTKAVRSVRNRDLSDINRLLKEVMENLPNE